MITLDALKQKFLPGIAPEDFFVLLAHATGKNKTFLLAHPEYELPEEAFIRAKNFFERRLKHEPVAYITGHREFYGRDFLVNQATLIPRPETELLIEAIQAYWQDRPLSHTRPCDILDVGTGSGNIILTLIEELYDPSVRFFGLDISDEALTIAQENAKRLTSHTIHFQKSNLLETYLPLAHKERSFLIAANLPYLSQKIFQESAEDVRHYEPTTALLSEEQGLAHYFRLCKEIQFLRQKGLTGAFFFEISPEQTISLVSFFKTQFPDLTPRVFRDLSGRERLIQGIFL